MKGARLGEFEEWLLLSIWALGDGTYAVPIQQYLERTTRRHVTMGAIYAALDRIEVKGLVRTTMGDPTPERGGKRKRHYVISPAGRRLVQNLRADRETIWRAIEEGSAR